MLHKDDTNGVQYTTFTLVRSCIGTRIAVRKVDVTPPLDGKADARGRQPAAFDAPLECAWR